MPVSAKKSTDADQHHPMVGYLTNQWVEAATMSVSVTDQGFRQGVTAVERLRTYGQRIFQIDAHLRRWQQTTAALHIDGLPNTAQISDLLQQLIHRNQETLDVWGESGITMVATPGVQGTDQPTFGLHLNQLPLEEIQRRQTDGQPLVITDTMQPPPEAWPRTIKVRSRLHYYLADKQARAQDPKAVGILLDSDGTVTETSVANIAIVEAGNIISPPANRILGGITQSVVEQLAQMNSQTWEKTRLTPDRLRRADEVLLMGTDGGLWFACQIDKSVVGDGKAGPIYRALRASFDHLTKQNA